MQFVNSFWYAFQGEAEVLTGTTQDLNLVVDLALGTEDLVEEVQAEVDPVGDLEVPDLVVENRKVLETQTEDMEIRKVLEIAVMVSRRVSEIQAKDSMVTIKKDL